MSTCPSLQPEQAVGEHGLLALDWHAGIAQCWSTMSYQPSSWARRWPPGLRTRIVR